MCKKNVIKKLTIVAKASDKKLKKKIESVISILADAVTPESVSFPDESITEKETPTILLQENLDNFSLLLRTLDNDDELIKDIRTFDSISHKLQTIIQDIVTGLRDALQVDDEEDLPEGDLNEFINSLETYGKEFIDLLELSSMMRDTIQENTKDKKSEPVEHKLNKIKLGPKKKEKEEDKKEVSKEDIDETVEQLNKLNL